MVVTQDRFVRQRDLVPREKLQSLSASVIGVGAIGRQVALQLATLGVGHLQLVDFDVVELSNVTTQGYASGDIGWPKVEATAADILRLDPYLDVECISDRYRPRLEVADVIFCGVDSISARRVIWKSAGSRSTFWADGRMRGESLRVLTAIDDVSREHYSQSLFEPVEAQTGGCTNGGTYYAATIAAGLMVTQLVRWLRGEPVVGDQVVNLLAGEWTNNVT
jgi:molybdopterin-synthase adenylyltransferase